MAGSETLPYQHKTVQPEATINQEPKQRLTVTYYAPTKDALRKPGETRLDAALRRFSDPESYLEKREHEIPEHQIITARDLGRFFGEHPSLSKFLIKSRSSRLAIEATAPKYGFHRYALKALIEAVPSQFAYGPGDVYDGIELLVGHEIWPTAGRKLDAIDKIITLVAVAIPFVGASYLRKGARELRKIVEDEAYKIIQRRETQRRNIAPVPALETQHIIA